MRIRSIKPEFWTSDDVAALSWPTRLLFIGLWSYVDDNGVGRDNERLIRADLFPLEDDPRETLATVSRGLQELCEGTQITRYTVDGRRFLYVNGWATHQRIDRPNKERYPLPTCENAEFARPSRDPRETLATGAGEQRNRGTGEQGKPPLAPSRSKTDSPERFEEFWETYSHKVGRKKSETAYRSALKKPGVTADLLINAASQYVGWVKAEGKHPQYTKHPATWLNGEHWTDERAAREQPQTRVQQHLALARQLAEQDQQIGKR